MALSFSALHRHLVQLGSALLLAVSAVAPVALAACAAEGDGGAPPTEAPAEPAPAENGAAIDRPSSQDGVAEPAGETFDGTLEPIEVPRPQAPVALLTAVEAGRHASFDRVVLELGGSDVAGYEVRYLDAPATACGSGEPVETDGAAQLEVRLRPAAAHTEEGRPTIGERTLRPGLPAIAELRLACDFEADVTWVVGTRERMPYRVLELGEPSRLVVDVLHPAAAPPG